MIGIGQWFVARHEGIMWWGELQVPSLLAVSLGDGLSPSLAHEDAHEHLYLQGNDCDDGEPVSPKDDVIVLLPFPPSLTRDSSQNMTP